MLSDAHSNAVNSGAFGPRARSPWRAVAIPTEHGGWGLTLEPALLGLLVAPSWAGGAIAVGAVVAFVVRTPLRVVLVDHRRQRRLARTRLATRVATVELAIAIAAVVVATTLAGWQWLLPVAAAAPLVAVELAYDMRSRSRRLIPELCGAIGMASVAASIAIAGGSSTALPLALWLILAARLVGSIPFVRAQIGRLHGNLDRVAVSDRSQLCGIATAIAAAVVSALVAPGAVGVILLCLAQLVWIRRPPVAPRTLGIRQMLLGFGVVMMTAVPIIITAT